MLVRHGGYRFILRQLFMLIFAVVVGASSAYAKTITFDEPTIVVPAGTVLPVSQIDDLVFAGLRVFDASNLYGHLNLAASGVNAAYFGPLQSVIVTAADGSSFDFNSAFFAASHGASFTLRGISGGVIQYSSSASTLFEANWINIDTLIIQSSFFDTGYNVMDDLSYTPSISQVPLPPTYVLMLTGLGLVSIFARYKVHGVNGARHTGGTSTLK